MKPERRPWIAVYLVAGVVAAFVAAIWNARLTQFFATTSATGAIVFFLLLPFLVIITRPAFVRTGARVHRGIGVLAAFRKGGAIGFFLRSLAAWIGAMLLVSGLLVVTWSAGGIALAAAISNWVYVASSIVLLAHVVPDAGFIAAMAPPMTVYVTGAPGSGKTTFIGVAGLDTRSRERGSWTLTPTEETTLLTSSLHGSSQHVAASSDAVSGEYTIVPHRAWSQFIGSRPVPLALVEVGNRHEGRRRRDTGRTGFIITLRAGEATSRASLDAIRQQLSMLHKLAGAPASRIARPVALVLTCVDDWTTGSAKTLVSDELAQLFDEHCRRWEAFSATSQLREDGKAPEQGELVAAGQLSVLAWLVTKI
ncbi:MAG: hypothetical protein QOI24_3249 [Acidobacteriota bacterium]|jgi:hypothetical protein|nr:hypothetical protein [Acidobacteriota bacterium]